MHDDSKDTLIRFIFDDAPVHGAIVSLDQSYEEVLNRHHYTPEVQQYLGQALATAALMSLKLKDTGTIILQTQGNGPISLLLAQANEKHEIRGLANFTGVITSNFRQALGKGYLAITQTPQNYQGVVSLDDRNLSQIIENYFVQSEQVPVYIFLCANEHRAAGLFLQVIPHNNTYSLEQLWEHISHLAKTITEQEMLSLKSEEVLHRLFHQEKCRILETYPVKFSCSCSRDRMAKAIINLGLEDARKLITEQLHKKISVTCEFCNAQTEFDTIDVETIFLQDSKHANLS